jgi:hypothetical protein
MYITNTYVVMIDIREEELIRKAVKYKFFFNGLRKVVLFLLHILMYIAIK